MTIARQALGVRGEDLACQELARCGYVILARRYRTRFGEIDIVSQHDGVTVFVEVKARRGGSFGDPPEAVTVHKQQRLIAMACDYLVRQGQADAPCRFDVVSVEARFDPPRVTVIADAFRPGW